MSWRWVAGLALLGHGFVHTLPGMRAAAGFDLLPTAAWAMALVGFSGAGCGLLGARPFAARWDRWAAAGVCGSAFLLISGWPTPLGQVGLLVDIAVLLVVAHRGEWLTDEVNHPHRRARAFFGAAATVVVALLGGLVLARSWYLRWGSTAPELQAEWPGDELVPDANYLIQHAVTIQAPPVVVWPWLAQLGQGRGGFYSYAWLENLFGLGVRNADRIHPDWQAVRPGDSVFATPPGWLGMDRRFGWRIARTDPGQVLVLEDWGAFILQPRDGATRLIVRTRGGGRDRPIDLALAPAGLLLFEPAHFVMQRKMLLEIKRLAELEGRGLARRSP